MNNVDEIKRELTELYNVNLSTVYRAIHKGEELEINTI